MADFVFKRYELKYELNYSQHEALVRAFNENLRPDEYGESTIQSLYFDTDNFRIARLSSEKPVYKEKLRLRCYGLNDSDQNVYFEMKRKYDGVVYKRRISCKESNILLLNGTDESQIGRELEYFKSYYGGVAPKVLIIYDRSAWYDPKSDLRVTIDSNVRFRTNSLNLHTSLSGSPLLSVGTFLMEVKTGGAIPLWLVRLLDSNKVKRVSFSKYGKAYEIALRRQEC